MFLVCIPFSLYLLKTKKNMDKSIIYTWETLFQLLFGNFAWMFASLIYIESSRYTLISHSILIINLAGVLIICLNLIRCIPVHKIEILGTIIVVFSSVILMNDSKSEKNSTHTNILKGDILALFAIPGFACFYIINAKLVVKLPSMIVLHLSVFIHVVAYLIC